MAIWSKLGDILHCRNRRNKSGRLIISKPRLLSSTNAAVDPWCVNEVLVPAGEDKSVSVSLDSTAQKVDVASNCVADIQAFPRQAVTSEAQGPTPEEDERSYDRSSEESIYNERSATSGHGVVSPSTGCTVESHGNNVRIGRNRDFRIDRIGASDRPGPLLDIPKPAQSPTVVSPPRAINAPVPCTPPAVIDSPRCRPNVSLDRRSTSTSLHSRRRRLVVEIPQSIAEADESTVVEENVDVSPYKEKEEVQVQDSTDDVTGVVFTVLQALQEDSTERLTPTFVYESDEDSCESCHSPSPAPSPAASSLFDEIPDSLTPVTTPPSSFAEKCRSSASYISPEDSCEEEVDIAPVSLTHGVSRNLTNLVVSSILRALLKCQGPLTSHVQQILNGQQWMG